MEDTRDRKLTPGERAAALEELPGWSNARQADGIRRAFQLRSFDVAIAFVNRVADIARELEHHPEITIRFSRVEVTCWTFECDGLTAHDVALAKAIQGAHAQLS